MKSERNSVVIIGNFDGFHLGHRKIVEKAKEISIKNNLEIVFLTFDPNPKVFFKKESQLIFNCDEKIEVMKNNGISNIQCLDFKKIHNLSGEFFIEHYLINRYKIKFLVIGENFKLGKGKEWDVTRLLSVEKKYGFKIEIIPSVYKNGLKISSTKIRELLKKGEIDTANKMLGYTYGISGIVEKGNKIGTELGYPTINIPIRSSLLPNGVYITETEFKGEKHNSITYIGNTPTFNRNRVDTKIETHIINFDKDIYGENVKIYFLKVLREEKKFPSKEALIRQIRNDIKAVIIDK